MNDMNKETILIITSATVSVLASPFVVTWIQGMMDKNKKTAEVHNLNISGEISIGESWQKYAMQQQRDKEELRKEFIERITRQDIVHTSQIKDLEEKFNLIIKSKDSRIFELEKRVEELQLEINKYKN